MEFYELERLMNTQGITSLADIARALSTTPQAVSNWKSRNQVPHRVVAALSRSAPLLVGDLSINDTQSPVTHYKSPSMFEEDTVSISDILLTMAEQLKVIVLVPFIAVFLTFTYVQFIKQPLYVSWATVLLPSNGSGDLGGFAGLASQFGVNVPTGSSADLSNPSLFPELLHSRTFAEKVLDNKFYTKKFGKELSLLAILTHGNNLPEFGRDTLITAALSPLREMVEFDQDPASKFSVIKATAGESSFAKQLAEVTLAELEALNRFYKSQTVNGKIAFIEQRIATVNDDLETSEQTLKAFSEQNRQISSPALQLDHERLARDVEIQKGIYLTLKQQLELAKIEEIQESSVVQIIDTPQIALGPSNKNLKLSILLAGVFGLGLGVALGFFRTYTFSSNMDERKKLRRVKYFFKKKAKDIILDRRVSGIVSALLLAGSPFYLGYESKNPVFFGMYSANLMIVNTIYVIGLFCSLYLFTYITWRKKD